MFLSSGPNPKFPLARTHSTVMKTGRLRILYQPHEESEWSWVRNAPRTFQGDLRMREIYGHCHDFLQKSNTFNPAVTRRHVSRFFSPLLSNLSPGAFLFLFFQTSFPFSISFHFYLAFVFVPTSSVFFQPWQWEHDLGGSRIFSGKTSVFHKGTKPNMTAGGMRCNLHGRTTVSWEK